MAQIILGSLAGLSLALILWQWFVGVRFPLHRRRSRPASTPPVSLLKPLKGADDTTERCLRSWFEQAYDGEVQILFAVASGDDPVCAVVDRLLKDYPESDARLMVCEPLGANAKISKVAQMMPFAKHDVVVISDADVWAPHDLLSELIPVLDGPGIGLAHCFYRLANPSTLALRWEAVAVNADFWSQVLQSSSLRQVNFALGAVMATRRQQIEAIGGLEVLSDCLADDYQLGNRIAKGGAVIAFCNVVVECWSAPVSLAEAWNHQLRWARTIRVCQPMPYFFSILSNGSLWPLLLLMSSPGPLLAGFAVGCCLFRIAAALDLQRRLTQSTAPLLWFWLIPIKDLWQAVIWLLAFAGNTIEWKGERMRVKSSGEIERAAVYCHK